MTGRRGLVVPQNIFLENIIKRTNGVHENFLLGSAQIMDAPIVYCSEGFTKLTGYKKNQVVRKKANCSFMYGSLTTKDAVRELRHALQEKTSTQVEVLFYKKDATPFWVLLNVGIINDEEDETVLYLLTFQDITEFKEPINPSHRKHRWSEFNRALHSKPIIDNPISKAKEEKNRIHIGQMMESRVEDLPEYKQDIPKTPWYVVLHCSTPKIVWDWFILIFILYTATSVPFHVCFKFESLPMTIADTVVDFMFLIDILLNFHTSYIDEDGSIVFDIKNIRRNYFRGWFFIDLVTSLPYGLLGMLITDMGKDITSLISFLKAVRLLRLNRVVRALDQYLEYGFITLILWMLFFCLCAHWMACIFFLIAEHYDNFADIGWVRAMSEMTEQPLVIINGTVTDKPTLASLYMSSLYFSLTSLTSIGFGNIAPNTTAEKVFSCVTMIFGGLCYAVIFGQVTAIVQQSQKELESYHETLKNMRSFCKLYKVPKEIGTRIIDYYMYNWTLTKGVDTNKVLEHCPKDLQSDICIHLNKKIIDNIPAFGELSNAVLRAIARNFAIHRVAPGERIVHEGESLSTLFFVASGSFEITQRGKVVGLVGEGDVFGDDVCRNNDVGKSGADVFALTYGDVHAIGRDELLGALSFYPEYGYQFAKVFRLSYNLREEASMSKHSAVPRVKSHRVNKHLDPSDMRRYSFLEEMQNNVDIDSNGCDLGTPNSQNMTDTDPPSKFFVSAKNRKLTPQTNGMKAISETSEMSDSAGDDEFKQWNDFQTRRENTEGLFNQISEMKSQVRQEIELMGGKMNHLEQNIATILSLLKEQNLSTKIITEPRNRLTPGSATSNRTAAILSKAKDEFPAEPLPDWVELEDYGMAGNPDVKVAVEKVVEEPQIDVVEEPQVEVVEKPQVEEVVEEPTKPSKKSLRKAKKKGLKNKRKAKNEKKASTDDNLELAAEVITEEPSPAVEKTRAVSSKSQRDVTDKFENPVVEEEPTKAPSYQSLRDMKDDENVTVKETEEEHDNHQLAAEVITEEPSPAVEKTRAVSSKSQRDVVEESSSKEETTKAPSYQSLRDMNDDENVTVEETEEEHSQQNQHESEEQENADLANEETLSDQSPREMKDEKENLVVEEIEEYDQAQSEDEMEKHARLEKEEAEERHSRLSHREPEADDGNVSSAEKETSEVPQQNDREPDQNDEPERKKTDKSGKDDKSEEIEMRNAPFDD